MLSRFIISTVAILTTCVFPPLTAAMPTAAELTCEDLCTHTPPVLNCTYRKLVSTSHMALPPDATTLLFAHNNIEDAVFLPSVHRSSVISNVSVLDISYNHIHCLDFNKLAAFPLLRRLVAHHNQIQAIIDSPTSFRLLRVVELNHNLLQRVSFAGAQFSRVQNLELCGNHIETMADRSFPRSLRFLNLSNNSLAAFNRNAFDRGAAMRVELGVNPWRCGRNATIDFIFFTFEQPRVHIDCSAAEAGFCGLCGRRDFTREHLGSTLYDALNADTDPAPAARQLSLHIIISVETSVILTMVLALVCQYTRSRKRAKCRFHKLFNCSSVRSHRWNPSCQRSATSVSDHRRHHHQSPAPPPPSQVPQVPPRNNFSDNIYSEVIDPLLLVPPRFMPLPPAIVSDTSSYIVPNEVWEVSAARHHHEDDDVGGDDDHDAGVEAEHDGVSVQAGGGFLQVDGVLRSISAPSLMGKPQEHADLLAVAGSTGRVGKYLRVRSVVDQEV